MSEHEHKLEGGWCSECGAVYDYENGFVEFQHTSNPILGTSAKLFLERLEEIAATEERNRELNRLLDHPIAS
jgi:argonaute-like protein implicated in RNA metabolism and viral defense